MLGAREDRGKSGREASAESRCIAREAEEPRSIQQKLVFRKGVARRRSHSIQQKVGAAVRLSQEQPSDEDEFSQNLGAYVRTPAWQCHRAHVEHVEQRGT